MGQFKPLPLTKVDKGKISTLSLLLDELTPRELEVLADVVRGLSSRQIAAHMAISLRTVESHRMNMLRKLQVENTTELAWLLGCAHCFEEQLGEDSEISQIEFRQSARLSGILR